MDFCWNLIKEGDGQKEIPPKMLEQTHLLGESLVFQDSRRRQCNGMVAGDRLMQSDRSSAAAMLVFFA